MPSIGHPRWFRWSALAVSWFGALSPALSEPAPDTDTRTGFAIPDAALVRPLGEIPVVPCPPTVSQACQGEPGNRGDTIKGGFPMTVAGLGIPLGGIGAGAFMINQSGTFGPWNFGGSQDDSWEVRALPAAAFHIREQYGSAPAQVRTLATRGPDVQGTAGKVADRSWASPLPGWHPLQPGEGQYAALYPFGWLHYSPFKTDVSIRFFSPIVAGEDRRTSLPVAYFDVRLSNPSAHSGTVSVMFTMPNAPPHVGRSPATVRKGFTSKAFLDAASGISGVTLAADDAANTPDADRSEWTIATRAGPGADVTFTPSWNADGDGSDVYAPFSRSGRLPNAAIDRSSSAGAVAVSVTLKPHETVTIPFVLAWDFPKVGYASNGVIWMRRYTDFYGARETPTNDTVPGSYPFHQSRAIASDALMDHDAALAAVEGWWQPIAGNARYPKLLRTAALNQLYQLTMNGSFWEGGLVSSTVKPTFGTRSGVSRPGLHLFGTLDAGSGYNSGNGIDVGTYNYIPYNLLFPNIERDRVRALAEAVMAAPHWTDAYVSLTDGPYLVWHDLPAPAPGKGDFIDVPSKLIARFYAAARLGGGDEALLRDTYPAMLKALAYLQGTMAPGQHLPSPASVPYRMAGSAKFVGTAKDVPQMSDMHLANTYDIIPVNGVDVYDAQLYLLALEIVSDTATRLKRNPAEIADLQHRLTLAKSEFETTFWDPANQFYRFTPGPTPQQDAVLLDTFFAQHMAERLDLPDLVDPDHYHAQLTAHFDAFFANRDEAGRPLGARNMLRGAGVRDWPLTGMLGAHQEDDIWVGANYFAAATYYAAGMRFKDPRLQAQGLKLAEAVASQSWAIPTNGFAFAVPEAWNVGSATAYTYPAYERPLAVWDMLDAIEPLAPKTNRAH